MLPGATHAQIVFIGAVKTALTPPAEGVSAIQLGFQVHHRAAPVEPFEQRLELGHVAEGVYTAREVDRLARDLGVEMPISAAVAAVLDGRMGAAEAVDRLMARDPKEELA